MIRKLLYTTTAIVVLSAPVAHADPISLAVAALSTAATALTGGTLFAFGLTGWAALAADFAVRAILGYALNSLTSKPTAISRGYKTSVNQIGSALPHQVIYGETVVGGAVFYQTLTSSNGTENDRLHRCIAYAGHEIDSYQAIYLNGQEVTLDGSGNVTFPAEFTNVRILQHLGSPTQTADSTLVSEVGEWTSDHAAKGVAYLYVRFEDASEFPTGIPTVSARIRGKKILDTRTSTTAWSDNPAMIIRDYLTSDFGLKEDSTTINDTLAEEAADVCDELVGSAKRYTCNGAFTLDSGPEEIIRSLLSSMGGVFWNYAGQWAFLAAEYRTPTISLDEDDLRGPLEIATRHSRRDNFNTVRGQYKGEETDWQADDYTPVTGTAYLEEDNNLETSTELNLLFTDTELMAQRISQIFLRRNRKQVTVAGSFGLEAVKLKVGDNVFLSVSEMGWSNKGFEVVDWRLGITEQDILVNMILREMDEEVFTGVGVDLTDESENTLTDESGNTLEGLA
jgi:hypothetical protein